jgi:hypothetical protein
MTGEEGRNLEPTLAEQFDLLAARWLTSSFVFNRTLRHNSFTRPSMGRRSHMEGLPSVSSLSRDRGGNCLI